MRWGLGSAALVLALSTVGCGEPGRVAPTLQGPFLEAPTRLWSTGDADAITRHTDAIYFLWTFPTAATGTPFHCELRALDVPGAPVGTLFANAEGRLGPETSAGSIELVSPQRGWEPGVYEARIFMGDHAFGDVSFRVTGSSW